MKSFLGTLLIGMSLFTTSYAGESHCACDKAGKSCCKEGKCECKKCDCAKKK